MLRQDRQGRFGQADAFGPPVVGRHLILERVENRTSVGPPIPMRSVSSRCVTSSCRNATVAGALPACIGEPGGFQALVEPASAATMNPADLQGEGLLPIPCSVSAIGEAPGRTTRSRSTWIVGDRGTFRELADLVQGVRRPRRSEHGSAAGPAPAGDEQ